MSTPKTRLETARVNAHHLRRGGLRRLDRAIVLLQEMQAEYDAGAGIGERDLPRLARLLRECRYHFSGALKDTIDEFAEAVAKDAEEPSAAPSGAPGGVIDLAERHRHTTRTPTSRSGDAS